MKGFSKYFSVFVFMGFAVIALGFISSPKAYAQIGEFTVCDSVNDPSSHLCDVYCNKLECDIEDGAACGRVLDAFLNLTEDPRFDDCPTAQGDMSCAGLIRICSRDNILRCSNLGSRCVKDHCSGIERCISTF